MVVRIRWNKYRAQEPSRLQNAALAIASLLAPSALMAFTIAIWNLAANLHWTGDFFVSSGVFSHWESWLSVAALMVLFAWLLNRYAGINEDYPK
jgi:hypothetical protein